MFSSGRSHYILKQYYIEIPYWIFLMSLFVVIRFSGLEDAFPTVQVYNDRNISHQLVIALISGFLTGFFMATARIFLLKKLCSKISVGNSILIQTGAGIVLFTLTTIIVSQFYLLQFNYSTEQIKSFLVHDYTKSSILILYAYFISGSLYFNILLEADRKLGINMLKNLILGKYHIPTEEERIFMFMDMKNSTGIAEKLGHLQYSHFLQDVFKLSTDVVIDKKGEIYQFVGDEMVVTWPSNLGYQNNNTLQLFYKFQAILEKNEDSFMKTYGVIPLFKAGIHIGVVSVAEVGEINTQIAYHGDVVNTTSRIQELCNKFHTNLLVSDSFMKGMEAPLLNFQENAAIINLRGRQQPITVYALDVSMPD